MYPTNGNKAGGRDATIERTVREVRTGRVVFVLDGRGIVSLGYAIRIRGLRLVGG